MIGSQRQNDCTARWAVGVLEICRRVPVFSPRFSSSASPSPRVFRGRNSIFRFSCCDTFTLVCLVYFLISWPSFLPLPDNPLCDRNAPQIQRWPCTPVSSSSPLQCYLVFNAEATKFALDTLFSSDVCVCVSRNGRVVIGSMIVAAAFEGCSDSEFVQVGIVWYYIWH